MYYTLRFQSDSNQHYNKLNKQWRKGSGKTTDQVPVGQNLTNVIRTLAEKDWKHDSDVRWTEFHETYREEGKKVDFSPAASGPKSDYTKLDPHLWAKVLLFLGDISEILALSTLSSHMYKATIDEDLWYQMFALHMSSHSLKLPAMTQHIEPPLNWRGRYMQYHRSHKLYMDKTSSPYHRLNNSKLMGVESINFVPLKGMNEYFFLAKTGSQLALLDKNFEVQTSIPSTMYTFDHQQIYSIHTESTTQQLLTVISYTLSEDNLTLNNVSYSLSVNAESLVKACDVCEGRLMTLHKHHLSIHDIGKSEKVSRVKLNVQVDDRFCFTKIECIEPGRVVANFGAQLVGFDFATNKPFFHQRIDGLTYFSADRQLIIVGTNTGEIKIFTFVGGNMVDFKELREGEKESIKYIKHDNHKIIVQTEGNNLHIFDYSSHRFSRNSMKLAVNSSRFDYLHTHLVSGQNFETSESKFATMIFDSKI